MQIQNICIQRLIVHILIKAAPGAIYTPGPAAVGQPAATPTLHFNVPPPSHFPLPPNFPPGSFFGISRVQKSCIRRQQCCGLWFFKVQSGNKKSAPFRAFYMLNKFISFSIGILKKPSRLKTFIHNTPNTFHPTHFMLSLIGIAKTSSTYSVNWFT